MNDIILNFGKHTGKKLSEVPREYLVWLVGQDIRRQPEAAKAAQAFLDEYPVKEEELGSQTLYPRPFSYKEASKLGWMAGMQNKKARTTMLAARDQDGFLCVYDENEYGEEDHFRLLEVLNNGEIMDAHFTTSSQATEVLARYPQVDPTSYLINAQEWEEMEADVKRRSLTFQSKDGRHILRLTIWSADDIEVSIDGRDPERYLYRLLNDQEHSDHKWKVAAAVLEHEYASEGAENIGLLPERKALVEQKIAEIASGKQGK